MNYDFLFYIAVFSTVFYLAMAVMTFIGLDAHGSHDIISDVDVDHDDSNKGPIQLFNLRNLITFLVGLSWGALIGLQELNLQPIHSTFLGLFLGLAMVIVNGLIMLAISKLHAPNQSKLNELIGKTCKVYLTIPAKNQGYGQVTVELNGSLKTLSAANSTDQPFKTGSIVEITDVSEETSTLIVDQYNS